TDPAVRARLLGIDDVERADVVPVLERLIEGGIRVHAQIVLCPGWNDGAVLEATVERLAALHPGVESVAVVPLGQTAHRAGLPALAPVTHTVARAVLEQCETLQARCIGRCGHPFVYLADEWYFRTGAPIPPAAHYRDFPQLEDGVGMSRQLIEHLEGSGDRLPVVRRVRNRHVTVVTGTMAAPLVREHLVDGLLARHARAVDFVVVENDFLGRSITVSGLLAGGDIHRAVRARGIGELLLLPPNCVNGRGLFLDDMALDALREALGVPVDLGLGDENRQTNPVWEKE
ncbi:MAG: DUF512 domain-containing protein, partial [Candidatus Eiseniibacteriota bacterium]